MNNWDNIRFFLALARSRNLDTAARMLDADESTVRRRVAALEKEIGAPLFNRGKGELELTATGLMLMESGEAIEHAIDNAETRIEAEKSGTGGVVRVGAFDGLGSLRVAPVLADLQKRMPQIMIELITLPNTIDVAKREADVALVNALPRGGPHKARKLRPVTLQLYGSAEYIAQHGRPQTIADLADHQFVGFDKFNAYERFMSDRIGQLYLPKAPIFRCTNVIGQVQAVAVGVGLGLLPGYAADTRPELIQLLPEEAVVHLDLFLLIHADVAQRPHVRAVAEALIAEFS